MFCRDVSEYAREPESVRLVRARVQKALEGSPRVDDAELAASELSSNLVQHGSGSWFELRVDRCEGFAHVEVVSRAGDGAIPATAGMADPFSETGRGLWIVANVADRHGRTRRGLLAADWCQFDWTGDPAMMADNSAAWHIWSATGCRRGRGGAS
jgi:hypothetical protein